MVQQGMVVLLRGASKRLGASFSAQRGTLLPSMYNLSRGFSSKLFVGGLSYHTNEEMLRKAFAEHGDVVDVRIITDRETGRSRGFGFITFSSEADAEAAKAKMSNHLLDGRFIRVDLASARPPQSPASPRPFGNSSSSPTSFSFGTPGTRPPSVEDWGPLPSYSTNTTQTNTWSFNSSNNNMPSQGAPDASNADMLPSSSSLGSATSSSSSAFEQVSSSTSNTSAFQSSTSTFEVQSSSNGSGTFSSTASVATQQSAVMHSGIVSSSASAAASAQGIVGNDSASANTASSQISAGQRFASAPSSDAGQFSAQTGSSLQSARQSVLRSNTGSGANNISSTAPSGNYDFRNFPDLTSNAYKDYKPPGELQEPKRHVVLPSKNLGPKRSEVWEPMLTEAAIPPPKGPTYDFGLAGVPDAPPPLDAGANPQGGFNLSVCLDTLPEAEPVRLPYSIFTARTLPPLDLPYLTPEADNWSPIGKPPRRIEDSPYSPFSPDLKDDPEFWWDPYDFDPEAKLLKEAFEEKPAEEAKLSKESEAGEIKLSSKEPEAEEAKTSKEPEAEESPAVNAAAS